MDLKTGGVHKRENQMIGLCNHNPYCLVYTKEELEAIMRLQEKHDLLIMNDEIWSDILYPDAQFNSIYCLGEEQTRSIQPGLF